MFTLRKLALLIIKINDDNHYQIEEALRSYCLLVLSSHRYLKQITKQKSDEDWRSWRSATIPCSAQIWLCLGHLSEENLAIWTWDFNSANWIDHRTFANLAFYSTLERGNKLKADLYKVVSPGQIYCFPVKIWLTKDGVWKLGADPRP